MKRIILHTLEKIINQALRLDPDTVHQLSKINHKLIAFEITDINWTLYIQPHAQGIHLLTTCEKAPDTTLKGTLLNLIKLGYSTTLKTTQVGKNNSITIIGDLELAQTLQHSLQSLDIDWEEQLSFYIGDIAAYQIGKKIRQARHGVQHIKQSLKQNISEYVQEETQLQPHPLALEKFYKEVTELRDATERLEARMTLYQKKILQ